MKKLQKLTLQELGELAVVLGSEQVDRLKGGYGSDYPYYCPGEVYCSEQGPGHIGTLGELQNLQQACNSSSTCYGGGSLITGLATTLGYGGVWGGLWSFSAGTFAFFQNGNADRIGAEVDRLQNMGYSSSSKLRIEYLDSYYPGVSDGGTYRARIWDAETGQLLSEIQL